MNAVALESRGSEAWKQTDVLGLANHRLGELLQDLWQPLAVPDRIDSVHWRRDKIETLLMDLSLSLDVSQKLLQDWLDPERH